MSFYPPRVQEHFLNPRNAGEVADADATGEAGSFTCGAILRLSLKIDASSGRISEARFKAAGCGFLIAAASVLTETVRELTLGRAAQLPARSIADWFGPELPAEREQCVALCHEALNDALRRYHNAAREEWAGDEALICTCFGVSEKTIERAVHAGSLQSVREVTRACNAGGGCQSCHPLIVDILEDYWRTASAEGE